MSHNDPPPLSGKEMLLVVGAFMVFFIGLCLLAWGVVSVIEWFWESVVCEDWVVCQ